jgi:hypothetical protein
MTVAIRDLKLGLEYYKGYREQIDKLDGKGNLEIYNSLPLKERNIISASFEAMRILESYRRKMRDEAGEGNEDEWEEASESEDGGDN